MAARGELFLKLVHDISDQGGEVDRLESVLERAGFYAPEIQEALDQAVKPRGLVGSEMCIRDSPCGAA